MSTGEVPSQPNLPLVNLYKQKETAESTQKSSGKKRVHRIHFKSSDSPLDYLSNNPLYRVATASTRIFEVAPKPTKWNENFKEWFRERSGRVVVLKVNLAGKGARYVKVNAQSLKLRLGLDAGRFDAAKKDPEALSGLVATRLAELNTPQARLERWNALKTEISQKYLGFKNMGFNVERCFSFEEFTDPPEKLPEQLSDRQAVTRLFSDLGMVKQLLSTVDPANSQALIHSVLRYTESEHVIAFLAQTHQNVDTPDNQGRSPLYWAVLKNDLGRVQLLKKYGADPTRKPPKREPKKLVDNKGRPIKHDPDPLSPQELAASRLVELTTLANNLPDLPTKSSPKKPTAVESAIQQRKAQSASVKPQPDNVEFVAGSSYKTKETQAADRKSLKAKFEKLRKEKNPNYTPDELIKSRLDTAEFTGQTPHRSDAATLQQKISLAKSMIEALKSK